MWLLTGAHPEGAKNYTVVNRERPQFLFIYLVSSRVAGLTAGQPIPPEHSLKLFIFWNTHSPVIHHPFIAPFSSSLFPCSPWEMCGGEWEEGNWAAAASPHCSSVQRSTLCPAPHPPGLSLHNLYLLILSSFANRALVLVLKNLLFIG